MESKGPDPGFSSCLNSFLGLEDRSGWVPLTTCQFSMVLPSGEQRWHRKFLTFQAEIHLEMVDFLLASSFQRNYPDLLGQIFITQAGFPAFTDTWHQLRLLHVVKEYDFMPHLSIVFVWRSNPPETNCSHPKMDVIASVLGKLIAC